MCKEKDKEIKNLKNIVTQLKSDLYDLKPYVKYWRCSKCAHITREGDKCQRCGYDLDYPEFVLLRSTEMRLEIDPDTKEKRYTRDAGSWDCGVRYEEGKFFSVHDFDNINNVELVKITRDEWYLGNYGGEEI